MIIDYYNSFFSTFKTLSMKKILFCLAATLVIMLSNSTSAHATNYTWYITFNIKDTCNVGGYTGDYCIKFYTMVGTTVIGTISSCVVPSGSCFPFTVNVSSIVSN